MAHADEDARDAELQKIRESLWYRAVVWAARGLLVGWVFLSAMVIATISGLIDVDVVRGIVGEIFSVVLVLFLLVMLGAIALSPRILSYVFDPDRRYNYRQAKLSRVVLRDIFLPRRRTTLGTATATTYPRGHSRYLTAEQDEIESMYRWCVKVTRWLAVAIIVVILTFSGLTFVAGVDEDSLAVPFISLWLCCAVVVIVLLRKVLVIARSPYSGEIQGARATNVSEVLGAMADDLWRSHAGTTARRGADGSDR